MVQIQQPGIGQEGYAMSNATKVSESLPVDAVEDEPTDPEVFQFRENFDARSTLDELVREGARKMLQAAIDAEVDEFIAKLLKRCVILIVLTRTDAVWLCVMANCRNAKFSQGRGRFRCLSRASETTRRMSPAV